MLFTLFGVNESRGARHLIDVHTCTDLSEILDLQYVNIYHDLFYIDASDKIDLQGYASLLALVKHPVSPV